MKFKIGQTVYFFYSLRGKILIGSIEIKIIEVCPDIIIYKSEDYLGIEEERLFHSKEEAIQEIERQAQKLKKQ